MRHVESSSVYTAPSTSIVDQSTSTTWWVTPSRDTKQRSQQHLEPVEKQLGVVSKALELFDLQSHELYDLQVAIEGNIQQQIQQLQELPETRKAELIDQLQWYIRAKKKHLAAQRDEVETVHAQLASCLSFVRESLRTGSQGKDEESSCEAN